MLEIKLVGLIKWLGTILRVLISNRVILALVLLYSTKECSPLFKRSISISIPISSDLSYNQTNNHFVKGQTPIPIFLLIFNLLNSVLLLNEI